MNLLNSKFISRFNVTSFDKKKYLEGRILKKEKLENFDCYKLRSLERRCYKIETTRLFQFHFSNILDGYF